MKNFLKKHIFARPTHFDHYSLLTMICGLMVIFAPFISCGPSKAELERKAREQKDNFYANPPPKPEPSEENSSYNDNDISVRVIDSCEYVIYIGYNIIHKENCRNPIHQHKK